MDKAETKQDVGGGGSRWLVWATVDPHHPRDCNGKGGTLCWTTPSPVPLMLLGDTGFELGLLGFWNPLFGGFIQE